MVDHRKFSITCKNDVIPRRCICSIMYILVHSNVQENKSLLCKASGFRTYCATLVSSVTIFSIRLFLKSHIVREIVGTGYNFGMDGAGKPSKGGYR